MSAELAAAKISEESLNLKDHTLNVVWAKPKPQAAKANQSSQRKFT